MNEEQLAEEFEKRSITLASIQKRAAAFFIDEVIISIFIIFAFGDMFKNVSTDTEIIAVFVELTKYMVLLKIVYQTFFVWIYGATPGKMLMKIKIIFTYSINKPNFITSLLRAFGRVVSESVFCIGFIWAYFNPKRQTWQDVAAKTLVIDA